MADCCYFTTTAAITSASSFASDLATLRPRSDATAAASQRLADDAAAGVGLQIKCPAADSSESVAWLSTKFWHSTTIRALSIAIAVVRRVVSASVLATRTTGRRPSHAEVAIVAVVLVVKTQ